MLTRCKNDAVVRDKNSRPTHRTLTRWRGNENEHGNGNEGTNQSYVV